MTELRKEAPNEERVESVKWMVATRRTTGITSRRMTVNENRTFCELVLAAEA